jgi:hypothetical protein
MAKDRENKEERLKKAREADRKKKKIKKKTVFRLHAAAKKQDKILEDTRITRSAITIDNKDEKIIIDDLPPSSTAPIALGNRSKRARAGTVDYRALTRLSRIREEIKRLNQKIERKKKAKAVEMALRSPIKKKSRFVDAKTFEKK